MKTIVIYGSTMKLTNAHRAVHDLGQPEYYIRLMVYHASDISVDRAIKEARPMTNETVLNAVEVN